MLNTPFTGTDCSLHLHYHAGWPELILQQGQFLLFPLMPSIPMASIYGSNSFSHVDDELHCFFQSPTQSVVVIEGTLVECKFLPFPKDGHTLFCSGVVPPIDVSDPVHYGWRSTPSQFWVWNFPVVQPHSPNTCKFTHMWAVLTWTAVSSTHLCILSSASATAGSWVSALPILPMVTPSRIDFTTSESNFDVTQLRASATALSLPFWYSILNVNPASDSTQWCQVASKLGVVKM